MNGHKTHFMYAFQRSWFTWELSRASLQGHSAYLSFKAKFTIIFRFLGLCQPLSLPCPQQLQCDLFLIMFSWLGYNCLEPTFWFPWHCCGFYVMPWHLCGFYVMPIWYFWFQVQDLIFYQHTNKQAGTTKHTYLPYGLALSLLSGAELRLQAFAGRRRLQTRSDEVWFNVAVISAGMV